MKSTPSQEFRLMRIALILTGVAAAIFATITWAFLKPGTLPWMYLLLFLLGVGTAWIYWFLTPGNCRQNAVFYLLMVIAVNLMGMELHRPEYLFVIFILVFACIITFNIILVHWPEVVLCDILILSASGVFMFWPATGFQASVAKLGLHPNIVSICILVLQTCLLVLGGGMVEVKRRTEGQLRFINENLNKLVEEKVSEIRRADRQARYAQEQLEKILRYTPVGVVIFDETLNCLYSNGVHFKFEMAGGVCRELPGSLLPLAMLHQMTKNVLAQLDVNPEKYPVGERLNFTDASQCERMLRYSFVPVTVDENDDEVPFKRLILITEDITEEELLRYKLIQADHLSAMGKMAAGLAHEINNPLSVIRIYVEALGQGMSDSDRRGKIHLVLKENILRIDRIIKSFLTFARQEKPSKEWVDVLSILKNTLELATSLRQFDQIKICTEFSDAVPPILGDQHRLSQVFVNLINNARDAMQPGGSLTVQYFCEGKELVICFKDTGHGIKPEDLKHIFTPFFTTKEIGQGTGLGLSISYGIIQEHGGSLEVESREGAGAAFTIRLPLPSTEVLPPPK